MDYGVVVNNKFALFENEDEDPLEVLQRTQEEAERKAKTGAKENTTNTKSKVAVKNAKNVTKPAAKTDAKPQPTKVLGSVQESKVKPTAQNVPPRRDNVAEKPPRFRQNENVQRRPPREDNRDQPRADGEFRTDRNDQPSEEFRGRGNARRGRGQGRGGASDGGFDRFGKREFERHSGSDRTGLKPVDKREGGGAHNWGTIADAVAEQEMLANAKTAPEQSAETDAPNVSSEEQPAEVEVVEGEDEKQMTLDEWKALQTRERAKPSFNLRKPGEGVQTAPEWKKMVVLKKKVNEEGQEEDDEEEEEEDDDAHGKQKQTVPIQIRFNDSGSRGGGFGGRRGRGRGGPGGPPGGRRAANEPGDRSRRSDKVESVPNVDNEFDFPSLA